MLGVLEKKINRKTFAFVNRKRVLAVLLVIFITLSCLIPANLGAKADE